MFKITYIKNVVEQDIVTGVTIVGSANIQEHRSHALSWHITCDLPGPEGQCHDDRCECWTLEIYSMDLYVRDCRKCIHWWMCILQLLLEGSFTSVKLEKNTSYRRFKLGTFRHACQGLCTSISSTLFITVYSRKKKITSAMYRKQVCSQAPRCGRWGARGPKINKLPKILHNN